MTPARNRRDLLLEELEVYGGPLYGPGNGQSTVEQVVEFSNDITLDTFREQIQGCLKCELGHSRTHFVFGVGNPNADLLFVGEAPGEQEDLKGEPFVGRAGKLLDDILRAIDLTRDKVYIANVLKCRPPENRDPKTDEIDLCEPYLIHQIKLIQPKLIVALGRIAGSTLLRSKESLSNMREKVYDYHGTDMVVTYHPAALLRNPNWKRPAWEDFKKIREMYLAKSGERKS